MKLLIPVLLRKALLACFAVGTLYSGGTTIAADLTLGREDTLSINYAESDSIPDLENGTLRLNGDTLLRLVECGEGNGKTYTLLTGVSGLLDKDGNALALDSNNNAISHYFDTTQPGTGFWADATLQLTTDGTLQLVRYTDISIPSGYREVLVDAVSDITYYSSSATDVAFRITQDLKISGRSSSLRTTSAGSWYFTSDSVEHLASLTFSNATSSLFDVASNDKLEFSRLERVEFSENSASSSGGAIYGGDYSTITLSGNGSVEFSGNKASSSGGAIYGKYDRTITLSDNGSVTFSGNKASSSSSSYARGGAIYSEGPVIITGNDEVTFAQNLEKSGTAYRLRSLYLSAYYSTNKLTLSAGKGQSIRFYDSVYMGASGSVALNADYTDAEGVTRKATGTILFSGATTEDDLKDAKGGVVGTEEEILNSRTSEINSAATLYGGTLQVQDKAVLKLNGGLTVADGSKASVQVQAAELNVGSHALNMVSGSSLLLSDGAKLTATELTISNGAELAVKAITANSPVQNLSAAFTIDTTPSTGYDASRAYNVLAGGKIDVALLTLAAGATYTANAANVSLSDGELTLAITSTATKRIELNLTLSADYDPAAQVVLFSDVATVNFIRDGITAKSTDGAVYTLGAADYFNSVWINNMTTLVYDSNQKVVYLEGVSNVPEPTTSTLGLLALAALAARRRRK